MKFKPSPLPNSGEVEIAAATSGKGPSAGHQPAFFSPDTLRILGSRIDKITFSQTLELIRRFITAGTPHHVITGNTLMILQAEHDAALHDLIEQAALVVPESWGIRWASRRLGEPLQEFIPGIDLMTALCRLAASEGYSIYLLGAWPGVAEAAGRALAERFPGLIIAGAHDGYFTPPQEPSILEMIRQSAPDFLFVGLNVPAQETWIARHLAALDVPVVMGVGGSFDVLSGRLRRAPLWMRRLGIEWVYRTLQEPWRWKRIVNLPVFMGRVLWERNDKADRR